MGYTRSQISDFLRQAGLPDSLNAVMTAIGLAEQPNGNPNFIRNCPGNSYCLPNQKPEKSVGIFQINVLAHKQYDTPQGIAWLQNPINNARAAIAIYSERSNKGQNGFRAWGSYIDGRYRQYLGGASIGGRTIPNATPISNAPAQSASFDFSQFMGVSVIGDKNRYLIAFAILVIIFIFAFN